MKHFSYVIVFLVFLVVSCHKDTNPVPETDSRQTFTSNHFYGSAPTEFQTKGIAQIDNLWPAGSTIRIRFLHDPYNMAAQIQEWAKEWELYANITFAFVDSGEAEVRIGFDWNGDRWITWSYIGTGCLTNTDQNDATISYAFWDFNYDYEMKGEVLRTFGQILGLELEHRHLNFDPGWMSESQVRKFWTGDVEDIPWEDLQKYVYTPLERAVTVQSENYDPESIMIWPFPIQYATNTQKSFNYELSDTDKEFIAVLYPEESDPGIGVYYNGFEHDLPEPDWDKLKTLGSTIGAARDIQGNYFFYPYASSGSIIRYDHTLTSSTDWGMVVSGDYRQSPLVIPSPNGYLLGRKNYSRFVGLACISLDHPTDEYLYPTSLLSASDYWTPVFYDHDRDMLSVREQYAYDGSEYIYQGRFQPSEEPLTNAGTIIYWGKKYKWVASLGDFAAPMGFYVYEQSDESDTFSETNLVAVIKPEGFSMLNGGIVRVFEYNNRLVVIRFGGSAESDLSIRYGGIAVLDPTGTLYADKYKIFTLDDASWKQYESKNYLCGGFFWRNKMMLYDQSYNKYYFELNDLLQ